jgi:FkbM family methyltransferase
MFINNRAFREILKCFKVHLLVDYFLRLFPRRGEFGVYRYQVASLEAWLVEKEIFKSGIYDGVFNLHGVKTFADLGCNRGFFSLWIAEMSGVRLKGILVEANPALIPQVKNLLQNNNLDGMIIFNGAAGAGMDGGEVEILVPPTDVGAGLKKTIEKSLTGDKCDLVRVAAVRVGDLWRGKFSAGERCEILKIDIEGAELAFLKDEKDFLGLVDRVVVEVHEAVVSLQEIRTELLKSGFIIRKEAKEDSETVLVFAQREFAE